MVWEWGGGHTTGISDEIWLEIAVIHFLMDAFLPKIHKTGIKTFFNNNVILMRQNIENYRLGKNHQLEAISGVMEVTFHVPSLCFHK